jgi:hypothetical protein
MGFAERRSLVAQAVLSDRRASGQVRSGQGAAGANGSAVELDASPSAEAG